MGVDVFMVFLFACPVLGLGIPTAIWILLTTRPPTGVDLVVPTRLIDKSKTALRAGLAFWLASLLTPALALIVTPLWGVDAILIVLGAVAMHGAAAAVYSAPAFAVTVRLLIARSIGGGVPGIVGPAIAGVVHVVGLAACLALGGTIGISAGAWFLVAPPVLALFAVWLRYPFSRRAVRAAGARAAGVKHAEQE